MSVQPFDFSEVSDRERVAFYGALFAMAGICLSTTPHGGGDGRWPWHCPRMAKAGARLLAWSFVLGSTPIRPLFRTRPRVGPAPRWRQSQQSPAPW